MKIGKLLLLLITVFATGTGSAQYMGILEVEESLVRDWRVKMTPEYAHVYRFGFSEAESELILFCTPDSWFGQIRSYEWRNDHWTPVYQNLTSIEINDNMFYSDQATGKFVSYSMELETINGLKIDNPWSGLYEEGEYEIGVRSYPVKEHFSGKYPQASYRDLSQEELEAMTPKELKIMRNEIFARYGYTFKSGGEMDTYFRKQDWYEPNYTQVDQFLTELEKANIDRIREASKPTE